MRNLRKYTADKFLRSVFVAWRLRLLLDILYFAGSLSNLLEEVGSLLFGIAVTIRAQIVITDAQETTNISLLIYF
jgi:hypothetical protein